MDTLSTYQAGQELKTELVDQLDTTATVVDLDPALVNAALAAGRNAISIRPPRVTYPTRDAAEATWSLVLIVPMTDLGRAWPALDALLAEVAQAVDLDSVEPASYQTNTGTTWPALDVTFVQPYDL